MIRSSIHFKVLFLCSVEFEEKSLPAGEKVSVSAILLKVYSQTNYATHKVKHPNLTITRVSLYRH